MVGRVYTGTEKTTQTQQTGQQSDRGERHIGRESPRVGARWRVKAAFCTAYLGLLLSVSPAAGEARLPIPLGYISDHANVLTTQSRGRLEQILENVDRELGVEFAIVTVSDLDGAEAADYANRLFEEWGVGDRESNRGILLLDVVGAPGRGRVQVEIGYGLEGVLPDGRVGGILDRDVIPHLKQGNRDIAYAAAVAAFLPPVLAEMGRDPRELEQILNAGGYNAIPSSSGGKRSPLLKYLPLILIALMLLRSRTGRGLLLGSIMFGGMGGIGRRGGGFGGGFGGFGGGLSGGGGAGRSY